MLTLLVEWSLRATALAGVVGLLLWAFRVRDVSARLAAWTVVVAGSLLMPVFTPLLPGTEIPIPKWVVEKPQPVRNAVVLWSSVPAEAIPVPVATPAPVPRPEVPRKPIDWTALAVGLWAAVAAAMMAQLAVGIWCGRRLRRAAYRLNLPAAAPVFESASVRVPLTLGSFRPAIVLPPSWQVWDTRKLKAVLAHESAHVLRHDPLRQLMASVYRGVFWFHPLAWWLHRELAELAEAASDDAALAATRDETLYAEILLHFFATAPRRVQWDAVAMATEGKATKRMERILDNGRKLSHGLTRGAIAALVLAAVPAVYLASAATPVWALVADQEPPAPPPPPEVPDTIPAVAPLPPAAPVPPAIVGVLGGVPGGIAGGVRGGVIGGVVGGVPALAPLPPTPPIMAWNQNAPRPPRPPRPPRGHWDGDDFAVITDDRTNMSGHFGPGESERLKTIRKEAGADILWFRHDGGEYIIKDPAMVAQAKQAIRSLEEQGKKMGEKGRMQGEYARQMAEEIQRQIQPNQAELERIGREMGKVGAEMGRAVNNDAEMRRLEQKMHELEKEMDAKAEAFNDMDKKFNDKNSELGKLQEQLGKEMEALGQEMERKAEEMQQQMKSLFDEAIKTKKAEKII